MESGNNGDLLTPTIMNASSYGTNWGWTVVAGSGWVSTSNAHNLPGPVSVNGTVYNGTGAARTWMFNNNNAMNFVEGNDGGSYTNITFAGYYTTWSTVPQGNQYDVALVETSNTWACMQVAQNRQGNGHYPSINAHASISSGSTFGNSIDIVAGHTYWFSVKYDGTNGQSLVALFDPSNGFAQVGATSVAAATPGCAMNQGVRLGRCDNHGNDPNDTSQAWFGNVIVDHTNAVWPLLPTSTDTPTAPPAVYDGTTTGVETLTTTLTTQLSANWTAASDPQSGITGYKYAIGTTAGGTNVVGWTSLGNVLAVTQTGLSLNVGTTYYFSVEAVNGVGVTGPATNSSGCTVVSSGSTVYFQDNFESWSSWGGPWSTVVGGSTSTINTSTAEAAAGTHSLVVTLPSAGYLEKNFTSAITTDTYTRFYVFLPTGWTAANQVTVPVLYVTDTPGSGKAGRISLQAGRPTLEETVGWTGVSGTALTENTWHYIEMHIAPPLTSTLLECWVDGTKLTTTLTSNFSGASGCTQIEFGDCAGGNSGSFYLDEFICSNSYNGPVGSGGPNPPANVYDGTTTGVETSTTTSTTQLSANWTAATDSYGTITGYKYAIGTTAGGTNVVGWTSLGNVLSVTKTGLSLTVGTTYYFSVEAVDSNSKASSATSSPGCTVQSSTAYFQDNFESWSTWGGAWSSVVGGSTSTLNTSTTEAAKGTHSLKVTLPSAGYLEKNISPTVNGDTYTRFYVFLPTGWEAANDVTVRLLYVCYGGAGSAGSIALQGGGQVSLQETKGWTGTHGPTLTENAWHYIEIHVGPPSTSTVVEAWVDGTKISTTLSANFSSSGLTSLEFGDIQGGTSGPYYLDELICTGSYNGP